MSGQNEGKDKISFEQAVSELEKIVEKLEKGELSLDESVEFFQEGILLSKQCGKMLDEAERKITVLVEGEKGELKEVPFEEGRVENS